MSQSHGPLSFDLAPECWDIEMHCMTVRMSLMLLNISIRHKANKSAMNTAWRPYEIRWPRSICNWNCPPKDFHSQAQTWLCSFHPLGVPTHLPLSYPFCSCRTNLPSTLLEVTLQIACDTQYAIALIWLVGLADQIQQCSYSSTFTFRSSGI